MDMFRKSITKRYYSLASSCSYIIYDDNTSIVPLATNSNQIIDKSMSINQFSMKNIRYL